MDWQQQHSDKKYLILQFAQLLDALLALAFVRLLGVLRQLFHIGLNLKAWKQTESFFLNRTARDSTYLFLIRGAEQLHGLEVDAFAALLTILATALAEAPPDAPEAYR